MVIDCQQPSILGTVVIGSVPAATAKAKPLPPSEIKDRVIIKGNTNQTTQTGGSAT